MMYLEVATECRNFENCRYIFTQYENSCVRCDLYCDERTLLGNMTIEGPVIEDRLCLYVKAKAMTEEFVTMLFKMNIVTACKKVLVDDMEAYCCLFKRNFTFNQQQAIAFA